MNGDRESTPELESEIASADTEIRAIQARLDDCHIKLCATAAVILGELHKKSDRMKSVATTLAGIDAHWARVASLRLEEAIREFKIKRGDREANMLLSLPQNTEGSHVEWVREMRLGETNSDSLIAACRYGTARLRALHSVVETVAGDLSLIDAEQAKACAAQLRLR